MAGYKDWELLEMSKSDLEKMSEKDRSKVQRRLSRYFGTSDEVQARQVSAMIVSINNEIPMGKGKR